MDSSILNAPSFPSLANMAQDASKPPSQFPIHDFFMQNPGAGVDDAVKALNVSADDAKAALAQVAAVRNVGGLRAPVQVGSDATGAPLPLAPTPPMVNPTIAAGPKLVAPAVGSQEIARPPATPLNAPAAPVQPPAQATGLSAPAQVPESVLGVPGQPQVNMMAPWAAPSPLPAGPSTGGLANPIGRISPLQDPWQIGGGTTPVNPLVAPVQTGNPQSPQQHNPGIWDVLGKLAPALVMALAGRRNPGVAAAGLGGFERGQLEQAQQARQSLQDKVKADQQSFDNKTKTDAEAEKIREFNAGQVNDDLNRANTIKAKQMEIEANDPRRTAQVNATNLKNVQGQPTAKDAYETAIKVWPDKAQDPDYIKQFQNEDGTWLDHNPYIVPETAHQLVGDQQRSRRLDQFDTVIGNQQNTKLSDAYFKLLKQLPTITNTAQQSQAIQQFMDSPLNKDKNGNQVMYVYKPGEIVHGSPYPSYTDPKVTAQINKLDAGAKLDDVMAQLDPQKLTEVIKRDRNMESIGQQDADAHTLTSQTGANRLQAEISGKIGGGKSGGNLSANEIAQATGKLAGAQSKVQDLQRALNIELSIDPKTPGFNQANHDLNVNNIRAGLEKANAEIVDAQAVLSYAKEHQNTSGINAPKTGGGSAGAKGFAPMGSGIKPPPTLVGANPQTPKVTSTMRPPAQAAGGGNPPPGFNPIKSITNPAVQKYGLSYNPSTNTYWSSKLGKVITLGK